MTEKYYELPKYKREKLYFPYRCPSCYKMLRIKILKENNLIKYNCNCKKEWFISYDINNAQAIKKPKILDYNFKIRCSCCKELPNKDYKFLCKCLECKEIICLKKKCKDMHLHQMEKPPLKNLFLLDVVCDIHSKDFIAYCSICDKDLCEACILEEKLENPKHNLIYYKDILPKKDVFIQNYNSFNKSSDVVASSFKGVRRKTNYRLIYFFHFREIVRNIYVNLSRFSKIKKYNFTLISNVLENSDFKLLEKKKEDLDLILNFKYCPTCFFNSSNYIFDFLNPKEQPAKTFFLENISNIINYCFVSFPKKKYFIIIEDNKFKLYNSKTFELIYTKVTNSKIYIDKYDFEDDRFIFNSKEKSNIITILYINSAKKEVTFNKFNIINKNLYTDIQLIKNGVLLQFPYKIKIYEDKEDFKIYDTISIQSNNREINNYPLTIGLKDTIIYEDSNNIYFYYMKIKKKVLIKRIDNIKAIKKINTELIVVFCSRKEKSKFYLINVPNRIVVTIYNFPKLNIFNEIPILDKYIIKNVNRKIEMQNILTSKKIYSIYYYGYNNQRIGDNLKLIYHGLLSYSGNNLVCFYTFNK